MSDEENVAINPHDYITVNQPDGAADLPMVQGFLELVASNHFMDACAADGRAQTLMDNGFTSVHAMASLNESDLTERGWGSSRAMLEKWFPILVAMPSRLKLQVMSPQMLSL